MSLNNITMMTLHITYLFKENYQFKKNYKFGIHIISHNHVNLLDMKRFS